ncbi:hypothetical protein K491DRAFT_718686 [Lophiostoma macrostomum CBS 122681]|uniref:Mid2 domain-containing protein n=1 Tax=Lophiostoma macrostomum CBS 122681 TaxID=1314788 RepID=A0A6A6T2H5_9PLEO|nr:hypothetical protein K491DRAFT_718686 [Lophiostoma macrostomum CBS 122681]
MAYGISTMTSERPPSTGVSTPQGYRTIIFIPSIATTTVSQTLPTILPSFFYPTSPSSDFPDATATTPPDSLESTGSSTEQVANTRLSAGALAGIFIGSLIPLIVVVIVVEHYVRRQKGWRTGVNDSGVVEQTVRERWVGSAGKRRDGGGQNWRLNWTLGRGRKTAHVSDICFADTICNSSDADKISQWYQTACHDEWTGLETSTNISSSATLTTSASVGLNTTTQIQPSLTTSNLPIQTNVPSMPGKRDSVSTGAIAGIGVGSAFGAIIVAALGLWIYKTRQKHITASEQNTKDNKDSAHDQLRDKSELEAQDAQRLELPAEEIIVELDSTLVMAKVSNDQSGEMEERD